MEAQYSVFSFSDMTAENIVDRQQQNRNGKKQYRRDEGKPPAAGKTDRQGAIRLYNSPGRYWL